MISHIHSATIAVSDQDAALDFYVNTLGWEKAIDNPMGDGMRFVTVVPPGATTQLVLGPPGWFNEENPAPVKSGITLITPDVDATYQTLQERGVRFKGPVEDMPWGSRAAWFFDPDGNEFFVTTD